MPKLTRQHFNWLAKTIAPMTKDSEAFIREVREFNTNRAFCPYRFRDAVESAVADAQAENDCGPDLYKLDDHIPH